jgi:hypothetical protein
MNKKLLLFTLMPLVLLVMVVPAVAKPIGPQKAAKNPNIMITAEGVELMLPSGGFNEWVMDTEVWYVDFMHGLDASKAKGLAHRASPLAIADIMELMTNETAALEAENMWGYVSYDVMVELFIFELMAEDPTLTYEEAAEIAAQMAAMWPEGIYVRFVNVGK